MSHHESRLDGSKYDITINILIVVSFVFLQSLYPAVVMGFENTKYSNISQKFLMWTGACMGTPCHHIFH